MATADVNIKIKARDEASKTFNNISKSTINVRVEMRALGNELKKASDAFDKVGSEKNAANLIRLENEMDNLRKSAKTARTSFQKLGGVFTEDINLVENLIGSFGALAIAGGAFKFAQNAIKAFDDLDAATRNLNSSLVAIGDSTEANQAGFQQLALQLSQNSEFSKQQILDAQAVSLSITGSAEATAGLTQIAADFASATGRDFRDALFGLSKAALGQTDSLRELGIEIDKDALKAEGFSVIVNTLNEQFGGSAQALVKTYGGQIQQLRNEFDLASAVIGKRFVVTILGAFELAGIASGTFAQRLELAFLDMDESIQDFLITMGGLAKLISSPFDAEQILKETALLLIEMEDEFKFSRDKLAQAIIDQQTITNNLRDALAKGGKKGGKAAADNIVTELNKALGKAGAAAAEANAKAFADAVAAEDERISKTLEGVVFRSFAEGFAAFAKTDFAKDLTEGFVDAMGSGDAEQALKGTLKGVFSDIPFIGGLLDLVFNLAQDQDFLVRFFEDIGVLIEGLIANVIPGVTKALPVIIPAIVVGILNGLASLFSQVFSASFWVEVVDGFVRAFRESFGADGFITTIWKKGDMQTVGQNIGAGFTMAARGGTDDLLRGLDEGFRDGADKAGRAMFDAFLNGGKAAAKEIKRAFSGGAFGGGGGADIGIRGGGGGGAVENIIGVDVPGVRFRRGVVNTNTPGTAPMPSQQVGDVQPGITEVLTTSGALVDSIRRLFDSRGF